MNNHKLIATQFHSTIVTNFKFKSIRFELSRWNTDVLTETKEKNIDSISIFYRITIAIKCVCVEIFFFWFLYKQNDYVYLFYRFENFFFRNVFFFSLFISKWIEFSTMAELINERYVWRESKSMMKKISKSEGKQIIRIESTNYWKQWNMKRKKKQ